MKNTRTRSKNKNTRAHSPKTHWSMSLESLLQIILLTPMMAEPLDKTSSHTYNNEMCSETKWINRFLNFDTPEVIRKIVLIPLTLVRLRNETKHCIIIWIKYAQPVLYCDKTIRIMRNFTFYLDIEIVYAWEIYCIHCQYFITFTFDSLFSYVEVWFLVFKNFQHFNLAWIQRTWKIFFCIICACMVCRNVVAPRTLFL